MIAFLNGNRINDVHFHQNGVTTLDIGYNYADRINTAITYSKNLKDNWNSNITSLANKYKGNQDVVYFPLVDTSKVTDMSNMFNESFSLQTVPSNLNTSAVKNMSNMFRECSSISELDLSGWDTSNVTNMSYMFYACKAMTKLILPENFGKSNTDMSGAFAYVQYATELDLRNFNTSNVTSFSGVFHSCGSVQKIDISGWDTSNATNLSSIFYNANKLTQVIGKISVAKMGNIGSSTLNSYSTNSTIRWIVFADIGKNKNQTTFDINRYSNWGVNSSEISDAKQSLIDSLITYSYDRAIAEFSTCTITLSANTKAVLTDEEIAIITSKGFTIA